MYLYERISRILTIIINDYVNDYLMQMYNYNLLARRRKYQTHIHQFKHSCVTILRNTIKVGKKSDFILSYLNNIKNKTIEFFLDASVLIIFSQAY